MLVLLVAAALAESPTSAVSVEGANDPVDPEPPFTLEAEVVSGSITVEEALGLVEERRAALVGCVQRSPCVVNGIRSNVMVNLEVAEDGSVVRSSPALANTGEAELCVLSTLSSLKIPGPASIRYTLNLPPSTTAPLATQSADEPGPIRVGSLAKETIASMIQGRIGLVRQCYVSGLRQRPDLAGKLTVKFVIAQDGTVSRSEVKMTELQHPEVEACILALFREMRFPEPAGCGIVIVSYPFVFKP